ncbi:MAG: cation transporter [Clostridia bacterium]|nr:cation transporter [Clostridia bacterium]MBQ4542787.1 cation transporter [Clostridia bacterium]
MLNLFLKSNSRQKAGVTAGIMGIVLNLLLFSFKLAGGLLTKSTAIIADAFNNLSDMGSSVITFIGFKMAGKPADKGHPFGHGRLEYLAGLFVSFFIIIMGFELAKQSFGKIFRPVPVKFSVFALVTLVVSIAVKLFMFFINNELSEKINSQALKVTARDSLNDCITTSAVLLGIVISFLTTINLDGYLGLAVSLFIMYSGVKSALDTINPMLGEAPDPHLVEMVKNEVLSDKRILGIHDLIIHNYGPNKIIMSLHAEVDSKGDVLELHDLIDSVEKELKQKFNCEAVIHMDPVVTDDAEANEVKNSVTEIVKSIDSRLSIHDFRMTDGITHKNLIFDMVVPYDFCLTDNSLVKMIEDRLESGTYYLSINIDRE